jgi:hypothetical protein
MFNLLKFFFIEIKQTLHPRIKCLLKNESKFEGKRDDFGENERINSYG